MLTPAEKICVTREEAAELCSLSPEGFDDWVRRGILCGPIPGTRRWSVPALRESLARATGLDAGEERTSPYDTWRVGRG
jgi:hypothetical protein